MKRIVIKIFFPIILLQLTACRDEEDINSGLLLPQIDSVKEIPLIASAPPSLTLLPRIDLADSLPPAGDQGDQGSCVAWTLGYNVVSYYENFLDHGGYQVVNGKPKDNRVFSPAFIYNSIKHRQIPVECNTGIAYTEAFRLVKERGICRWASLPYFGENRGCSKPPDAPAINEALQYLGYYFRRINGTIRDIKTNVASGIPVIIGVFTSDKLKSFGLAHSRKKEKFIWAPKRNDKYEYHSMLIVGYDDSLKLFKLMNCWGTDWGNNGYCYINYSKLLERCLEFYICKKEIVTNFASAAPSVLVQDSTFLGTISVNTMLSFKGFNMAFTSSNISANQISVSILDSTTKNAFRIYSKNDQINQFYIADSLITLTTSFDSVVNWGKKRTIGVNIDISSDALDSNLLQTITFLDTEYIRLNAIQSPTEIERKLLKEIEEARNGNKQRTIFPKLSWINWQKTIVLIALSLIVIILAFLFIRRVRKHRKKQFLRKSKSD